MPKEYVHDIDYGRTYRTEAPDGKTGETINMGEKAAMIGWMKDPGGAPVSIAIVDRGEDPDGMAETVAYLNLDRQGLNRMIKVLQAARNGAYGKDA